MEDKDGASRDLRGGGHPFRHAYARPDRRVWQAVGHADVHGRSDRLREAGRHDRRSRCLSGRRGGRHQLVRGGARQAARRGRVQRIRGTPAQTRGATQGRQVRSRRRPRRGPQRARGRRDQCAEKRGWVGRGATRPERGTCAAGHGDDRAVQLRDGTADHRPGTHPGTLPRAAHPDQDAQARRMPSQREHGGTGHARCAEGLGQGMEGPQGAGGPAGEEHETHPGGARPPAARHLLRQHGDRRDPGHRRRRQSRTHPQRGRVRPGSAAPAPSLPPAARPTGTGLIKAATGRATPPCTTSPSSACATTSPPATT